MNIGIQISNESPGNNHQSIHRSMHYAINQVLFVLPPLYLWGIAYIHTSSPQSKCWLILITSHCHHAHNPNYLSSSIIIVVSLYSSSTIPPYISVIRVFIVFPLSNQSKSMRAGRILAASFCLVFSLMPSTDTLLNTHISHGKTSTYTYTEILQRETETKPITT